jgi:uncharacterized protein (DUF2267 family)
MKEISIKIDNELYRRASQKVENFDAELKQLVAEYLVNRAAPNVEELKQDVIVRVLNLESVNGDDDIVAARARMAELFVDTKNFGVGARPSREEMHGR